MTTVARTVSGILLACLGLVAVVPGAALGMASGCRVHNITQDTYGRSLIRMVELARDGDRIRVRGTCRGEIVIDDDITIRGVGDRPTLTGRGESRVVKVRRGAAVTLRGLVITQGTGVIFGAGVSNRGSLTVRASQVVDNHTFRQWGMGGGISNWGRLWVIDSVVRGNRARRNGGGIMNDGRTVIKRTLVARNATTEEQMDPYGGGGIYNLGRLKVVGSRISANRSVDNGGGIYSSQGPVTVIRSTVARNTANSNGGGIASDSDSRLVVTDSAIVRNTSGYGGGGMSTGLATLTGSTVFANTAYRGGGIWGGTLSLVRTVVTGNTAEEEGGGIDAAGVVTLDTASSVTGNVPDDCVGTPSC